MGFSLLLSRRRPCGLGALLDPPRRVTRARAELRANRMMAQQVALRRDWYLDLLARRTEIYAATRVRASALLGD